MKNISLKEKYTKEVVPAMREKFGYKNNLAVPRIEKVSVNIGVGRLSQTANFKDKLKDVIAEFAIITGQKPQSVSSKKSISGFKLREGQTIGLKVTLRKDKMYDFLERIIKIVFPRVRDFRGVDPKGIDMRGNMSIGFKEHVVFPEISPETSKVDFGLEVTIVTNSKAKEEALELYRLIGIPLKKS